MVTPFKKHCTTVGSTDLSWNGVWKRCPNSNYCVKEKYFCDKYTNCGWPTGLTASDEKNCIYKLIRYNVRFFRMNNLPINIIVVIIVLAFIVLIIGCCKKVVRIYQLLKKPVQESYQESEEIATAQDTNLEMAPPSTSSSNTVSVINQNTSLMQHPVPVERLDSPPSYDEVVKDNESSQGLSNPPPVVVTVDRSKPPPYSP